MVFTGPGLAYAAMLAAAVAAFLLIDRMGSGLVASGETVAVAATEVARKATLDVLPHVLITLIAVPLAWKTFLAGFILFRGFDIIKPPPVRQLERLPEGTGIVIDDVAAGVYALAGMHLLLHFGLLR